MSSLFTKIINREIPAKIFHETDKVIVIADIAPKAPVHLLIIPKEESGNFYKTDGVTLHMLNETVKIVADKLELQDHFKILINNGFGQEVDHLHIHFLSDKNADKVVYL